MQKISKKTLLVDLLIIAELKDVQLQNELGVIFRRYNNIIEYKEPKCPRTRSSIPVREHYISGSCMVILVPTSLKLTTSISA